MTLGGVVKPANKELLMRRTAKPTPEELEAKRASALAAKRKAEFKDGKVLLVTTNDSRRFLTFENNFPLLVEFARTCGAEISVVKVQDDANVLGLEDLAKSICDHQKVQVDLNYEVLETRLKPGDPVPPLETSELPPAVVDRAEKVRRGRTVTQYIKQELLAGREVTVAMLEARFSNYGMTKAAFNSYLRRTQIALSASGFQISRPGRAKHFINRNND